MTLMLVPLCGGCSSLLYAPGGVLMAKRFHAVSSGRDATPCRTPHDRTMSRDRLRRRLCGRPGGCLCHWLRGADVGSGTVAGVMLILLVAVMLSVVAAAGNLLVCQARARSAADLAALSAAVALRDGADDSCGVASVVVSSFAREFAGSGLGSDGVASRLDACAIDGEDVQVTVAVATQVPFAPHVERSSRAGPVACE